MGICIQKNQQNLQEVCLKQPQFQIDKSKNNTKCVSVWKITENSCDAVKWPFTFDSISSYVILVASNCTESIPIIKKDRTSLELAEMLFGAQFLCLHMKFRKKLMLNNKPYQITMYSFYGDSEQCELMARVRLTYYMQKLIKYLQFGAGLLCLSMLNQCEPVPLNNEIKEYIDFQSQQYEEAHHNIFFKEQLFCLNQSIKQNIKQITNTLFFDKFKNGFEILPHIDIKQQENKKQLKAKKRQAEQQMPFACQITQIDIKGGNKFAKIEAGNIDQSNILLEQLGIDKQNQQNDGIEQFLKGLYLSTEKASKNFSLLNKHKIKLIINCAASTCKNWFINDINYKWIDMPDPAGEKPFNIECLIYQVADLAGKYLAEPSGVLIHCSGYHTSPVIGTQQNFSESRSASILIGLIMASLKISYDDAFSIVKKKWEVKIPEFMEKQLKNLQSRRKQKPKGFYVYSICSYSANYPKHLVAKYICEVENINNIQGIDDFAKSAYLFIGASQAKVMVGRQCEFKEQYEKYAKEHFRLISKYEDTKVQLTVEPIDKTFRKQPKIQINQQILHLQLNKLNKNAGFIRNEEIVLKYPILRPVWEKKKEDGFYFTIKEKQGGAQVVMNKGMNWIGFEEDKEDFFDRIINTYLNHIPHEKIFIMESEQDKSLFDVSQINI